MTTNTPHEWYTFINSNVSACYNGYYLSHFRSSVKEEEYTVHTCKWVYNDYWCVININRKVLFTIIEFRKGI